MPHSFQKLSFKMTLTGNCFFSVLVLLGRKKVGATYTFWELLSHGACGKGQVVWLGGIWGNPASSPWEENCSAQQCQAFLNAFLHPTRRQLSSLVIPRASLSLGSPEFLVCGLVLLAMWRFGGVWVMRAGQSWQHPLPSFTVPKYLQNQIFFIKVIAYGTCVHFTNSLFELIGSSTECSAMG